MNPLSLAQNGAGRPGPGLSPWKQGGGLMGALAAVVLSALSGCGNPSYDVQIKELPPDPPGVAPGPNHRPGQPCLLCHGPYKGASPQLSIAGTVFKNTTTANDYTELKETDLVGLSGVRVTVYDPDGNERALDTNEAGNFYATADQYAPKFPLGARMDCTGDMPLQFTMISRISREGSCNGCHNLKRDQSSPGWLECIP